MLSQTLAALSDPTRREILRRLMPGPSTVNELAAPFSMSQQAVSKHLAYLENAKLIRKMRRGREHFCTLEARAIRQVAHWAEGYRKFWEASHNRLDVLLETMQREQARRGKTKLRGQKKETRHDAIRRKNGQEESNRNHR